jgi:hypothetical protein
MSFVPPFQIENFAAYCDSLKRVDVDLGYVMYTNEHAGNGMPAARSISSHQLEAAQAYIDFPSDETFIRLVKMGALLDTEWDRNTQHWVLIAFEGWEALHRAFSHLHVKSCQALQELTGLSDLP